MADVGWRSPFKFENAAGTLTFTFPRYAYEWSSSQSFRVPVVSGIGADYGHDPLGLSVATREPAKESVRFVLYGGAVATTESNVATMRATLARIGRGKLFVKDRAGVFYWAWARLESMPDISYGAGRGLVAPVSLSFVRLSDWQATSQTTGNFTFTFNGQTTTINNPGNVPVKAVTFTITTCYAPTIANDTTGEQWASSRNTGLQLVVDCGALRVTHNGSDDYSLFTIGSTQVGFMRLDPGNNTIRRVAASNSTPLQWAFYAAYA